MFYHCFTFCSHFQNAFFHNAFFHMFSHVSHTCGKKHVKKNTCWKCIVKKCILNMRLEKKMQKILNKCEQMHLEIMRGKTPGHFFSLDLLFLAKGSPCCLADLCHKRFGDDCLGGLFWWWSCGYMDWFENRLPPKLFFIVDKYNPNSSYPIFCFLISIN